MAPCFCRIGISRREFRCLDFARLHGRSGVLLRLSCGIELEQPQCCPVYLKRPSTESKQEILNAKEVAHAFRQTCPLQENGSGPSKDTKEKNGEVRCVSDFFLTSKDKS